MTTSLSLKRLCATSIIAAMMLAISACSRADIDFSEFRQLPQDGWAYGDTLQFIPLTADSIAEGTLTVSLCHNNNYIFSNLWLEATYTDASGVSHCDTINMVMANDYGRWYGRGLGAVYQMTDTINPCVTLKAATPVTLRHVMRVDTLRDIEQIGVSFVGNIE